MTAATGVTLYQQQGPNSVLIGEVSIELPNGGGTAKGTINGIIYPLRAVDGGALVDAGLVRDAGPPLLDAGSEQDAGQSERDGGLAVVDAGQPPTGGSGTVLGQVIASGGSGITSFGVPFAQGKVTASTPLALRDANGLRETASRVLATWPDGSVKWSLLTSSVNAGNFDVVQSVPPAPSSVVTVALSSGVVTASTGTRNWTVSGTELLGGSGITSKFSGDVGGQALTLGAVREFRVVSSNSLQAVVLAENATNIANIIYRRIYTFRRGDSPVLIRHVLINEGTVSVIVNKAEFSVNASLSRLWGQGIAGAGTESSSSIALVQEQRQSKGAPYRFTLNGAEGTLATAAVLEANIGSVFLRMTPIDFAYLEPQAARATSDAMRYAFVDNHIQLATRQAIYAEIAVEISDSSRRSPWVEPVALPTRATLLAAEAFEKAVMTSAGATETENLIARAVEGQRTKGLYGLNIYGSFPRTWKSSAGSYDEIASSVPPEGAWNAYFASTAFTVYHNNLEAVTYHALSTENPTLIRKLTLPGYKRMLYTQGWWCSSGDSKFFCGAWGSGYGRYRLDENSSHAYAGVQYAAYYLTGDFEIPTYMIRGANTMRKALCASSPTTPCSPTQPTSVDWVSLWDRVFGQHMRNFRFLGETGADPTLSRDFASNMERHLAQTWRSGTAPDGKPAAIPANGSSTSKSNQLFMSHLYDLRNLQLYADDLRRAGKTADAARVESALTRWVSTLFRYGGIKASDNWPNRLAFSGGALGAFGSGTFSSITKDYSDSDASTYNSGKGAMTRAICAYGTPAQCADWLVHVELAMKSESLAIDKIFGIYSSGLTGIR